MWFYLAWNIIYTRIKFYMVYIQIKGNAVLALKIQNSLI